MIHMSQSTDAYCKPVHSFVEVPNGEASVYIGQNLRIITNHCFILLNAPGCCMPQTGVLLSLAKIPVISKIKVDFRGSSSTLLAERLA